MTDRIEGPHALGVMIQGPVNDAAHADEIIAEVAAIIRRIDPDDEGWSIAVGHSEIDPESWAGTGFMGPPSERQRRAMARARARIRKG